MSREVGPSLDHVADEFESLTDLLLDDDVTLDWPRQVLIEIHNFDQEVLSGRGRLVLVVPVAAPSLRLT
jgi:hypothetical protein